MTWILRAGLAGMALLGLSRAAETQQGQAGLLARIDSVVAAEMQRTGTPGLTVAVEQRGELLLAQGYGFANLELSVPATVETIYQIASITKQFTALAIMQLVDQGKVRLTDEITRFLPDYPAQGHRITIEHLLTHTSGIRDYTGLGPRFWSELSRLDLSNQQMLGLFQDEPFDFNPGEQYRYSNSGYFLLGLIVEKVTGSSLSKYFEENIFRALGLRSTSYCDFRAIVPRRASGYAVVSGNVINAPPISINVMGGAGAICSTVLDLLVWQRALNQARLLSPGSRDRMRTAATLNDGKSTGYGFGLGLGLVDGHRLIAHGGGVNGFMSWLGHYPEDDLTIVVLSNTGSVPAKNVGRQIGRVVLQLPLLTMVDPPLF